MQNNQGSGNNNKRLSLAETDVNALVQRIKEQTLGKRSVTTGSLFGADHTMQTSDNVLQMSEIADIFRS